MLGITHQRIVREIAEKLRLGTRETGLFETGSVSPDNWADFPHHKGKRTETLENILGSRVLFLEGDDECYFQLGVALHYIQDRWTLRPRLSEKHTQWEVNIESEKIINDNALETLIKNHLILPSKVVNAYLSFLTIIQKGVEGVLEEQNKFKFRARLLEGVCRKVIIFAMLGRPSEWSSPVLDLNFAYRVSQEISRLVLLPVNAVESKDQWDNKEWLKKLKLDFGDLGYKYRGF
jgi:hypothetical protein